MIYFLIYLIFGFIFVGGILYIKRNSLKQFTNHELTWATIIVAIIWPVLVAAIIHNSF